MTTLTKYKEDKLGEIESLAGEIIQTRLRVVEASQLADELKAETDQGLSLPYPEMALYYGKQRAILRGLTQSDVIYFDLPTSAEWSTKTNFTLPAKTQFGYIFVDSDGNDSKIVDPELYYLTRKKDTKTLSTIGKDSDAFSYPAVLDGYGQQITAVDEKKKSYEIALNFPATPGSLRIFYNAMEIGRDDGSGRIRPSQTYANPFVNAAVIYNEKVILNLVNPPEKGTKIKLVYDTYTGVDEFEENYEQVDFTLSQKVDFGQALELINVGQGVISEDLELLDMMYLRRKSDHQQAGIVQVLCEGLVANAKWDQKTGNPAEYLKITHDQFKALLGYLNPDISNDQTKSANPEITSNGRESGGSYPDIEASPFFPWTDGDYTESQPNTGNFVHSEEGTPKWSVHPDIKWQYGTAPASLGQTAQEDPGTFFAALNAINSFFGAGNNPVPADTGSSSMAGKSYAMVGGYVYEFDWYDAGEAPPFTKSAGSEYGCYYNDVQHLRNYHLTHLQNQCGLIAALGSKTNTIEPAKQPVDSQFITDTATFQTALDAFLAYHSAFDPISGRPAYATSQVATLKAATEPGAYLDQATVRIADLESTIGTATAGGYSKIIYDSCNMATHMDIGYLRDVIDELNSIQDLYSIITDTQNQYAMLP